MVKETGYYKIVLQELGSTQTIPWSLMRCCELGSTEEGGHVEPVFANRNQRRVSGTI